MDILSRINLGDHGDVDAGDKFSAGGWLFLRATPGGGARTGTGNGSLLAKMGDEKRRGGAGWDIAQEALQIIVSLTPVPTPSTPTEMISEVAPPVAAPRAAKKGKAGTNPRAIAAAPAQRGIQIATKLGQFTRDEWVHLFVTYDGSRKGTGVKIYLNGKLAETEVKLDAMGA
jgi:hypothetical protein